MKKDKKKIKEPFEPGDTPNPPQIIEPNSGQKREKPVENKDRNDDRLTADNSERPAKQHLLSEESDIEDETTI
jgi:hypothetical protein